MKFKQGKVGQFHLENEGRIGGGLHNVMVMSDLKGAITENLCDNHTEISEMVH